jgi:predicted ATPase
VASPPHSVESRLRREVADHRLEVDPVQRDAAVRLDRLSAELLDSSRSAAERLRELLHW